MTENDPKHIEVDESLQVRVSYDVELYGKRVSVVVPFVIGVLADLSGSQPPSQAVEERKFLDINEDSFDRCLRAVAPRLAFSVPNRLTGNGQMQVNLVFERLKDFSPASVALKIDGLREAVGYGVTPMDARAAEQLNLILHHEEFRRLEGTWRGLHHLVRLVQTNWLSVIKVFNISKEELSEARRRYQGDAWQQSPLFKEVYESAFGMPGGQPFSLLVGDYFFSHAADDVDLLAWIAQVAAAAHAPFIAGADPSLMGMDSWKELASSPDPTRIFERPEYEPWHRLRSSSNSVYLGLTVPRFLGRLPYGGQPCGGFTEPAGGLGFKEDTDGGDADKYVWCNSAYAMAANAARAFRIFGWPARIRGEESGGMADGLPLFIFPTKDGGTDLRPTEVAIGDELEAELARSGLTPLSHRRNTDFATFVGAQTLHKPAQHDGGDAAIDAGLAAGLHYLLPACRFAHYLKCQVRDKIGSFASPQNMEKYLNLWLASYVAPQSDDATESDIARRPLAVGQVRVTGDHEVAGGHIWCGAEFLLLPHYQLGGLKAPLRLVTDLPSPNGPWA